MARSSSIHYIAPSSISIVPNANGSASDLAVFVARGTAVRVYEPRIAGLGMEGDTYRQWTLTGRNRRLAEDGEYRIYARLSKTDGTAYLVFSKNDYVLTPNVSKTPIRAQGDDGKYYDWPALSDEQYQKRGYWWVSLGTVSASEGGVRTVSLDTGILGTDRYNEEYSLSPDAMPLRVELGCTVDDEDAGPTPYVPLGKPAVLTAVLLEGWSSTSVERFDHWEITRYTEDAIADDAWNHPEGEGSHRGMDGGSIRLVHSREAGADDFNGAVAAVFTVSAWGRPDGSPEPSDGQETDDTPDVEDAPVDAGDGGEGAQEGGGGEQEGEGQDVPELVVIASASITMYPETSERFEIVPSTGVVSYNSSSDEYIPADGVTVRVRATDQRGDASDLTYGQFSSMGLSLEYASEEGAWTQMSVGGATSAVVTAVVPTEAFSEKRGVSVRLVRNDPDGGYARELARTVIDFVQDATDTKEREWIFLRSKTDIVFGDVGSAFLEPYLIARGQVTPEGEASDEVPYDDQLDGWVPQGWWDEEQGVSDTWCYEYASYRDYVSEEDGGHWGPFTKARIWHHFAGLISGDEISDVIDEQVGGKYISKQVNDAAAGVITFLKGIKIGLQRLFGWDAEGNITANDVNVSGLLTSMQAKINELFSSNFSGSGIFESGWLLTNNHNGHSYLEIDELLVRMKAVFMELEIRKETYSGGNVFYSPAGSIIYRVEPQNASNEPLGQRTIETVRPWSWSRRLLGLFGLSKIGLFSHKYVVKIQDDVDPSLVHHYRCYLIADDGTVQTRNWWHDNDQARCQTFNRASEKHSTDQSDQTNPNFDDNYVQRNMDGNRFFWRLVTNTGSTKLEDGKWYDYVDLDNFTPDDGYVRGSDVPVAGDSIVCIGNRVEEERMNMIMLEVIGNDAPAIKIYKGINSFSLDGRKYMNVSPKKIQLRSGSIEYISDNGQILPPKMSRGAWVSGVRYHYYDEVSHSGSTWLCIIIDGYRWEDAQGNIIENEGLISEIRAGEGLFVYGTDSHGEDLKDRYYSIGTYDGAPAYKVRKYTINEPSDLHAAEWQKEVSAGGSGVRGSFKSRVFARTNTNIATEYYTPTGGSYEYPWPGGENPHTYRGVTWHDGVPAGKEILWSSVCTFYGAGGSSEWSTPSPETDTADLDIEFSPSATKPLPPMTGDNDTPPTTPVGTKIDGDNTHGSRANGSGSEADWYDAQKDANNTHADWENARWRAERKISNGAYDGEWVITKIKGEDGDGIPGDFKSTAFIRTNVDISNVTPTGGTYSEPWPTSTDGGASWSDGIPDGDAMLWASVCTFYGDGTTSGWSTPRKMMDTQDYDVEFAFEQDPDVQPQEPNDYNRYGSANQIWFDPILDNPLPAGTSGTWSDMVWRAERETINGEVGAWVVTRIKGEKGEIDPSQIPQSWIDEVIDEASKALQEGLSIIISPQVIFVRQDSTGQIDFDNATADVEVFKSDVLQVFSIPSGQSIDSIAAYGKTDSGYDLMQGCASAEAVSNDPSHPTANTLWRVKLAGIEHVYNQQTGEYDYAYDNGYIRFKVNVTVVTDDTTTPPTTTTKSYWMKVAWYLNRLGNRTTKMWGDIEQTYMSRTEYSLADLEKDQTVNLLRGTQNPQIGATALDNNLWSKDNSQDLTIETLAESPISGYNKAFHIGTTSGKFYQIGSFWEKADTYRFSAYVRGVGGNATAVVEVAEPIQGGAVQTNTVAVGTEWQYVVFAITISNFNNGIDCMFRLGSSNGTVEFLAPTVVDITSPSVIRTDYEGQIQTSASGLDTKFTAITNSLDGRIDANTSNISTLNQTASGLTSRVASVEGDITTLDGDLDNLEGIVSAQGGSISTIQQTSDRISFRVINGWKNYITNPVATDATAWIATEHTIVEDSVFGTVRQVKNSSGGDWQLIHQMDSNYAARSGEMLTWFCVVSNTAYNNGRSLNFGTGFNLDYDCYQAVMMTADSSGIVTVSCGLGEGYFEEISYGQTLVYTNSENDKWYLCWASAKPIGSIDIRDGSDMVGFNSMTGTWKIYYAGVVMGEGCPGIDVIRQEAGIRKAGIDIENGMIHMQADKTIIDSDVSVSSLETIGDNSRVRIKNGITEFFGVAGIANIRLGIDAQGCAILNFYDNNGNYVYGLGPNDLPQQLNSKASEFSATASILLFDVSTKANTEANVSDMASKSSGFATYYLFIEGYSAVNNVKTYKVSGTTTPSSYNQKVYDSNSRSSSSDSWHPTGTQIASGYYIGVARENGSYTGGTPSLYKCRDVYYVRSTGAPVMFAGTLYYKYENLKAHLTNMTGTVMYAWDKSKNILDYLNGNDGTMPRI